VTWLQKAMSLVVTLLCMIAMLAVGVLLTLLYWT
jgi:hypothetical protein